MTALVFYRASCPGDECDLVLGDGAIQRVKIERWKPSIFMPRVFSRLDLEVVSVWLERLHEITEDDAKREGVRPFFETCPNVGREQRLTSRELARDAEHRAGFALLWDEINGSRALWKSNPYVWRVEFRRVDQRLDADGAPTGGDRPILFSAPMVAAIIAGTKTVTRRLLKADQELAARALGIADRWSVDRDVPDVIFPEGLDSMRAIELGTPFRPGEHLWVKETFAVEHAA